MCLWINYWIIRIRTIHVDLVENKISRQTVQLHKKWIYNGGGGGGAGSAFDVFRAETCIAFLDFFFNVYST